MEQLKTSLKLTMLLMAMGFMAVGCQKDDLTKPEDTQTLHPTNPQRVQVKTGNNVSKKAKAFLKEKTNNSFRIALQNNGIVLSKNSDLYARETSFGTINTEKEIVVVNETNTKHTFKVETVNQDEDSIINVIVVETPDGVYEYFIKYTFVGIKPYLPDGSFDISRFTGTIETYNRSGIQTSIVTFNDGDIVDNEVDDSPCPEDDLWDGWEDYWDDNDGGSGGGGSSGSGTNNDGSGNSTGTGGTSSGSGSGSGGSNGSCGLSYHYECNAGYEGSHPPAENPSMPGGMCSGAGPGHGGILVVTGCNNEVIASSDNLNRASNNANTMPNPCDEGITGVLIGMDELIDDIEECLGIDIGNITYNQADEIHNYLITQNQCSEEAQAFAEAVIDAGPDTEVDYVRNIIYTINKPCQKEVIKSIMELASTLTNLINDTFDVNDKTNVKFWNGDIPNGSPAQTSTFFEGTEDNFIIKIKFDNTYLDSATDLSIVAVTLHELVHAYLLNLYLKGELIATDSDYESLLNAFIAFYDNMVQDTFNTLDNEWHNAMEDFISQIADGIYAYAQSNDINIDLNYCLSLAWGTMHGTQLFDEILSQEEQNHAQNILITEQNNIEYDPSYPIKGAPCE